MEQIADKDDRAGAVKRLFLYVLLPVGAVLLVALGVAYLSDIPVTDLLRDPSATLDGPWYTGIFSMTGVALWASTAAMCLLTMSTGPTGAARSLLIAGAVISLILGVDDGFLIHETIKNEVGIPSPVTIGIYGIVAILLLRPAWSYLLSRSGVGVFMVAVALFAVSAVLDGAGEAGLPVPPFSGVTEDIAKFLGIVTWTTFFAWFCRDLIRERSPARIAAV
jgi:hypothetical protein